MNSIEFIRTHGWDEAKFLTEEWDGITTHWDIDEGFVVVARDADTNYTDMNHLDQLVKSWEYAQIHGLEKSKDIIANAPDNAECYSWSIGDSGIRDKTVNLNKLKITIADIESIGEFQ